MASAQEKTTVSAPSRNASAASETEWTAGGTVAEVSDLSSTRSASSAAPSTLTAVIDSIDLPAAPNQQPVVKGIFHNLSSYFVALYVHAEVKCIESRSYRFFGYDD